MQLEHKQRISKLEQIFNIKVSDEKLYLKALTHSSYTKENSISSLENYERLEFLGDAVLKICISEILYKEFPEYAEGDLTKIRSIAVSDATLADVAIKLGLDKLIILGKQEEKTGGRKRKSIIACTFEAVLGACYLEKKSDELFSFLESNFKKIIKNLDENIDKFNAKAVLQEYTQSQNKKTPDYQIVNEIGPQHDKLFVVEVSYMGSPLSQGQGKTKREAEQDAAYKACLKLGVIAGE